MRKILSIDDEPSMLHCLRAALERQGYILITTGDPEEGLEMLKNDKDICLALLDVKMPKKSGFEIYSELLQHRKLPVLFVTAYPRSFNADDQEISEMWQEGFADGTTDIVYKPFHLETLFDKVEALIGAAAELEGNEVPAKKKILSIDDEPSMLYCIEKALSRKGYELAVTNSPEEGLQMLRDDDTIALALLDVKMPTKNGFEIYNELKEFRKIPVLFVTAYPRSFNAEQDDLVRMWEDRFSDGTTDIVYKPFHMDTLFEKVESLIGAAEPTGEK